MKKVNYDKFGKGLSGVGTYIGNNKKPLLYIGGAIAVVIVGFTIVKRVKGAFTPAVISGGKFVEQEVNPQIVKISNATAKNYAETLFEAFNYTWGTDKGSISQVFDKINSEDFKLVYNQFGKRSYSTINGGTPSGKWWSPDTLGGSTELDLISWINAELGWGDSALREKIRKVVEPAGFIIES
jgi:hypothetical protein